MDKSIYNIKNLSGAFMVTDKLPKAVIYKNGILSFLDQTQLPLKVVYEEQKTAEQIYDSIKQLKVRGAPAIGIAGAYGLIVSVKKYIHEPVDIFLTELKSIGEYLVSSRPTAVNLSWAVNRIINKAKSAGYSTSEELWHILEQEAENIYNEDKEICKNIGRYGAELIENGSGILTHCNAGALAVSELGTALAPIYTALDMGKTFKVYADETRPLLQGARLTSYELQASGADVTLICDNMAAYAMSRGLINMVIVGCDRVAANGDTANKIGTMNVAILANYFKIPFYVACPSSTFDNMTLTGSDIVIEQRNPEEVTHFAGVQTTPDNVKVLNPAFDVTPNELITGFITEYGIIIPPYIINLENILHKGWKQNLMFK